MNLGRSHLDLPTLEVSVQIIVDQLLNLGIRPLRLGEVVWGLYHVIFYSFSKVGISLYVCLLIKELLYSVWLANKEELQLFYGILVVLMFIIAFSLVSYVRMYFIHVHFISMVWYLSILIIKMHAFSCSVLGNWS